MTAEPVAGPVGIVGAGPVGLVLAARLASFGVQSVLFERDPELIRQGSKACLIQGDALEVLDKIGCAQEVDDEGVTWTVGHTYVRNTEIRRDVYPDRVGFGAFVNISQFRIEQIVLARVEQDQLCDVRWAHTVSSVEQDDDGVTVAVSTPDGDREFRCSHLVACDGVRSGLRESLGVRLTGYTHKDRFLITDIKAVLPLAKERHFHYDPSFNPGRQLVMHPQPDDVWRIDWQLPPDADIDAERANGDFDRRVRQVIGDDVDYEIDWVSTYRFHQRVVETFKVGRVLLAGDAAHALPPYGSRGMNSGIQDADNLAWKLAHVLRSGGHDRLLASYDVERHAAARENLRITEATIRFMVPPNALRRMARSLLLAVSRRSRRAQGMVNSGRMAEPFTYRVSPIVDEQWEHPLRGAFAPDCAIGSGRLRRAFGNGFVVLIRADDAEQRSRFVAAVLASTSLTPADMVVVVAEGPGHAVGVMARPAASTGVTTVTAELDAFDDLYRITEPTWFLVRPDGHIAAGGAVATPDLVAAALARATGAGPGLADLGRVEPGRTYQGAPN